MTLHDIAQPFELTLIGFQIGLAGYFATRRQWWVADTFVALAVVVLAHVLYPPPTITAAVIAGVATVAAVIGILVIALRWWRYQRPGPGEPRR